MKKAAVIGYPISHTLSPKIHNYWLEQYGIKAVYEAIEVTPDKLEDFLKTLPEKDFTGINVTLPHKEKILQIVDYCDEASGFIGAANTIVVGDNKKLYARNTDVYGFVQNIIYGSGNFNFKNKKAVILGSGGAAKAVCAGLLGDEIGIAELIITNRTRERAEAIKKHLQQNIQYMLHRNNATDAEEVKEQADYFASRVKIVNWEDKDSVLEECSLLVNTTSLGMDGQPKLEINLTKLPKQAFVNDIVYKPINTDLLIAAQQKGNKIIDGLGMLLYQAAPAFEMFFGIKPEVTAKLRSYINI